MLGYERLTGEEKVRRAVRAAWFEMPQAWVDALRAMPGEVKLTRSAEMWIIMRDTIQRKVAVYEPGAGGAGPMVAHLLLNCDDW